MNQLEILRDEKGTTPKDPEELTQMDESQLIRICQEEISQGTGSDASTSDTSQDISLPLDFYFGRLPGMSEGDADDPIASRFVSRDIQNAVEATKAEILPMFSGDELCNYVADSEEDEKAAMVESSIANYIFFHEHNGQVVLKNLLHDCLLLRNGSAKVSWVEKVSVNYEKFDDLTDLALNEVLQPNAPNQTVDLVKIETKKEKITIVLPDGIEIEDDGPAIHKVEIKRMTTVGSLNIENIPPERMIVSTEHTLPTVEDARFTAHRTYETRSDLIEKGYDPEVVAILPTQYEVSEEFSRDNTGEDLDELAPDPSMHQVELYDCYLFVDFDGDGIAERRNIVISGSTILANEPVETNSLICGVTTEVAHKYRGISSFDRLHNIQTANTHVMRSIINSTRLASNPRIAVDVNIVNLDDANTSKWGGMIRKNGPGGIEPVPNFDIGPHIYQFIDRMNQYRREGGGGAIETSSMAKPVGNSTAHEFERSMSAMEQNNAMLARTFANTLIRGIFQQIHDLLRDNMKEEISRRIGGQWVTTNPAEWKKRTKIHLSIGSSMPERMRMSAAMKEIAIVQAQLAQGGSTMYSQVKQYKAITKAVRLTGIHDPESYFVDPESEEGQAAEQQKAEQQQKMQQMEQESNAKLVAAQEALGQAELMKSKAQLDKNQLTVELESVKGKMSEMQMLLDSKVKTDELEFKYVELEADNNIEMLKLEESRRSTND